MKKLTAIDLSVGFSCLLLLCTSGFAVVMATIMRSLFFAMYSDVKHPVITDIFLSVDRWGCFVLLVTIVPSYFSWSKGHIQKHGLFLMISAHILTIAIMVIVVCGMLWPLLTTTWGLSGK